MKALDIIVIIISAIIVASGIVMSGGRYVAFGGKQTAYVVDRWTGETRWYVRNQLKVDDWVSERKKSPTSKTFILDIPPGFVLDDQPTPQTYTQDPFADLQAESSSIRQEVELK